MIGVNPPRLIENQRHGADTRAARIPRLARARFSTNVGSATALCCTAQVLVYHTPSPPGQQDTAPSLLPHFSGPARWAGAGARTKAGGGERIARFRALPARQSSEGTETCRSRTFFSPWPPAAHLRPAGTRSANRLSAVQPLAQALRPSPAAALPRVQPLVLQATSPTASSIQAGVTDPTHFAHAPGARPTRSLNPAQPPLRRGFRVDPKTKKDLPCSRKS